MSYTSDHPILRYGSFYNTYVGDGKVFSWEAVEFYHGGVSFEDAESEYNVDAPAGGWPGFDEMIETVDDEQETEPICPTTWKFKKFSYRDEGSGSAVSQRVKYLNTADEEWEEGSYTWDYLDARVEEITLTGVAWTYSNTPDPANFSDIDTVNNGSPREVVSDVLTQEYTLSERVETWGDETEYDPPDGWPYFRVSSTAVTGTDTITIQYSNPVTTVDMLTSKGWEAGGVASSYRTVFTGEPEGVEYKNWRGIASLGSGQVVRSGEGVGDTYTPITGARAWMGKEILYKNDIPVFGRESFGVSSSYITTYEDKIDYHIWGQRGQYSSEAALRQGEPWVVKDSVDDYVANSVNDSEFKFMNLTEYVVRVTYKRGGLNFQLIAQAYEDSPVHSAQLSYDVSAVEIQNEEGQWEAYTGDACLIQHLWRFFDPDYQGWYAEFETRFTDRYATEIETRATFFNIGWTECTSGPEFVSVVYEERYTPFNKYGFREKAIPERKVEVSGDSSASGEFFDSRYDDFPPGAGGIYYDQEVVNFAEVSHGQAITLSAGNHEHHSLTSAVYAADFRGVTYGGVPLPNWV